MVTSKDLNECFLDSYLSPHFFFFQMAFEDPDVQGIYLLTDGKPVSLWFIMPLSSGQNRLIFEAMRLCTLIRSTGSSHFAVISNENLTR